MIHSLTNWVSSLFRPGEQNRDNFEKNASAASDLIGATVTVDTLFQCSAILCAVRVISQGVAQCPVDVVDRTIKKGRSVFSLSQDDGLTQVLSHQPNEFQTNFSFKEFMIAHAMLGRHGGFAYINQSNSGQVLELLPIAEGLCEPVFDQTKFDLRYKLFPGTSAEEMVGPDKILHLRGLSWNGFSNLPAVKLARAAVGMAKAIERSQEDLWLRGGRTQGFLSSEDSITPERANRLKTSWNANYGPSGSGGTALLDDKLNFQSLQMSAVEGQVVEQRKFQIDEIARITGVSPQMLMHSDKSATHASAEAFFIAHVVHCLDPWMDRYEQEIKKSVLGWQGQNKNTFIRVRREGLMRGALADQAEYWAKALGSGGHPPYMTQNEVRVEKGLEPFDDEQFDRLPPQMGTAPAREERQ